FEKGNPSDSWASGSRSSDDPCGRLVAPCAEARCSNNGTALHQATDNTAAESATLGRGRGYAVRRRTELDGSVDGSPVSHKFLRFPFTNDLFFSDRKRLIRLN
ncbi:hypothetical protein AVEN_184927-1, partial [Araneus ventricosus]